MQTFHHVISVAEIKLSIQQFIMQKSLFSLNFTSRLPCNFVENVIHRLHVTICNLLISKTIALIIDDCFACDSPDTSFLIQLQTILIHLLLVIVQIQGLFRK